MTHRLNDLGRRVWKHKASKILFAEQAYSWVDSVVIIQEDGDNRQLIEIRHPTFITSDNWVPMTQEEYAKVTRQYKEIYDEA